MQSNSSVQRGLEYRGVGGGLQGPECGGHGGQAEVGVRTRAGVQGYRKRTLTFLDTYLEIRPVIKTDNSALSRIVQYYCYQYCHDDDILTHQAMLPLINTDREGE